jgi:hypothetical protein
MPRFILDAPRAKRRAQMALVITVVTIAALVILGVMIRRPESDKGWHDQAEGLRERLERKGYPRA